MLLLEYEGHAVSQDNYRSSRSSRVSLDKQDAVCSTVPSFLQQEQEEAIGQNGRKERGSGWFLLRKSNALILLFPTRKAQSRVNQWQRQRNRAEWCNFYGRLSCFARAELRSQPVSFAQVLEKIKLPPRSFITYHETWLPFPQSYRSKRK